MKNGGSFHSYVNVYQRVKPMKTWKISGSGSTWPGISHGFPWHRHGFPTCRIWPSCWSHMLGRTKRWKRLTSGVWRGTMNGKVWGNHGFVTGKSNGDFRLTPKLVFVHWFFQKLWFTKIVTGKPQFFLEKPMEISDFVEFSQFWEMLWPKFTSQFPSRDAENLIFHHFAIYGHKVTATHRTCSVKSPRSPLTNPQQPYITWEFSLAKQLDSTIRTIRTCTGNESTTDAVPWKIFTPNFHTLCPSKSGR